MTTRINIKVDTRGKAARIYRKETRRYWIKKLNQYSKLTLGQRLALAWHIIILK